MILDSQRICKDCKFCDKHDEQVWLCKNPDAVFFPDLSTVYNIVECHLHEAKAKKRAQAEPAPMEQMTMFGF